MMSTSMAIISRPWITETLKISFSFLFYSARVLQRSAPWSPPLSFVSLKFELAFNLAVIWMIVFVALGKGVYDRMAFFFQIDQIILIYY